jgi:ATP-dependent exoDNAse (exonuclease V) alpha subunit
VSLTGGRVIVPTGVQRYSTHELLKKEQWIVSAATFRREEERPQVSRNLAVTILDRHPTLSDERRQAVGRLVTRDGLADVLVAPAGSGKTFSLNVARSAWEAAGFRVIGVSLATRAAKELEEQAGIRSVTVKRLLQDLGQGIEKLDQRTVLVVDEAAMVGRATSRCYSGRPCTAAGDSCSSAIHASCRRSTPAVCCAGSRSVCPS